MKRKGYLLIIKCILLLAIVLGMAGCAGTAEKDVLSKEPVVLQAEPIPTEKPAEISREEVQEATAAETQEAVQETSVVPTTEPKQEAESEASTVIFEAESETSAASQEIMQEPIAETDYLVVIDAGHQKRGSSEKEPIGPGAAEQKAKVTGGTTGTTTGLCEYELNLSVAEKLQAELEAMGYQVIMVRTTHDVDISNSERAAVANEAQADAFIRIHANGSDNPDVHGAMTICQTPQNPYNAGWYEESRELSEKVLDALVAETGCKRQRVWETDTMSGINWCQVPVTIVEMGYMTNPEEDTLMATDDYQQKLAKGIANGIDDFLRK